MTMTSIYLILKGIHLIINGVYLIINGIYLILNGMDLIMNSIDLIMNGIDLIMNGICVVLYRLDACIICIQYTCYRNIIQMVWLILLGTSATNLNWPVIDSPDSRRSSSPRSVGGMLREEKSWGKSSLKPLTSAGICCSRFSGNHQQKATWKSTTNTWKSATITLHCTIKRKYPLVI